MVESIEMTAPVTRGELMEALELWGGALRAHSDEMERRLFDRMDNRMTGMEARLIGAMTSMETRLVAEIARVSAATVAEVTSFIDEKYKDLPGRVTRLEDAAPAPRRTRRRPSG